MSTFFGYLLIILLGREPMDMVDYSLKFIGIKYTWGGESADEGFDCSGFVQECLAAVGKDPALDQNAQAFYNHFVHKTIYSPATPKRGTLLFFGKDEKSISHIAIAISSDQMIEAGGEGRVATTRGMVRIRPITARRDLVAILYP
jgi:cell wall-associated NlpC family hydrolase